MIIQTSDSILLMTNLILFVIFFFLNETQTAPVWSEALGPEGCECLEFCLSRFFRVLLSDRWIGEFRRAVCSQASTMHVLLYLQANRLKQVPTDPHSSTQHFKKPDPDFENLWGNLKSGWVCLGLQVLWKRGFGIKSNEMKVWCCLSW